MYFQNYTVHQLCRDYCYCNYDAELNSQFRLLQMTVFLHCLAIVFLLTGMWVCVVFLIKQREKDDYSPWYCL